MKDLIILSPSKEMDLSSGNLKIEFDDLSLKIINKIRNMDVEELQKFFKIKLEVAEEVFEAYKNIEDNNAKYAIETYNGLAFRQIDGEVVKSEFSKNHLVILSALYGPISPVTPINPYRLDFSKKLTVGNSSLKEIQKKNYTEKLSDYKIYNLASDEFSSLINRDEVAGWVDINFYDDYEEKKKTHSATSKKLRGQLANYVLKNKSFDTSIFESFEFEEYRFSSFIDENNIIYEKIK